MSEEKISEEKAAYELLATQLACPDGQFGTALAVKMNESNIKITSLVVQQVAPQKNQKILEIGLGNGQLSLPVIEAIGEKGAFLAVEKSKTMAKQANALFESKQHKNAYAKHGDFMHTEIQTGIIDAIYCVNVLYFIDDLTAFFTKAHQCLSDNGKVVIGVRSPNSLKALPFTEYGFIIRETEDIIQVMQQVGFKNVGFDFHLEGEVSLDDNATFNVDSVIIYGEKN